MKEELIILAAILAFPITFLLSVGIDNLELIFGYIKDFINF